MVSHVLAMASQAEWIIHQKGPLDVKRQKQLDWNDINKSLFSREADLEISVPEVSFIIPRVLSEAATRDEGTYSIGVYCGGDQPFGLWQQ